MPDEEFMTREEYLKLFAQWREDYALRREEDARPRLPYPANDNARPTGKAGPAAVPPHPWPSEIAKAHPRPEPGQPATEKGNDTDYSL